MAEAEATPPPPNKKSNWLLWTLVILVIGVAGAGIAFYFNGKATTAATEKPKPAPALYYKIDPALVVNFEAEQLVRFLQVTIEVMTRDPATLEQIKQHDPVVRNDLLLLLSNQTYDSIATAPGKEQLRKRALEAVRTALAREGADPARVEAVYFTSFVMQ